MTKIDQVLVHLSQGDAVGDETLNIRNSLRLQGYDSDIYVQETVSNLTNEVNFIKESEPVNSDIILYHYTGVDNLYENIRRYNSKKVLIYHNVTPYEYFIGYDDYFCNLLKNSRDKLKSLNKEFDMIIADSEYNKYELESLGFSNIEVVPILIDFSKYNLTSNIIPQNKGSKGKILFVGRVSPQKKIEELIMIFNYYNKNINPDSQLVIVGDYNIPSYKGYKTVLERIICYYNIKNVFFTGKVSLETLIGYYKWADVFITMSAHEGFCVPLLESMYFKIPIIAKNVCAIPETLSGAGILINKIKYDEISELIDICINDKLFRDKIIEEQNRRLKEFSKEIIEKKLINTIKKIL
jgi:glycosyltransferase involved in cell wall biosynthesis